MADHAQGASIAFAEDVEAAHASLVENRRWRLAGLR